MNCNKSRNTVNIEVFDYLRSRGLRITRLKEQIVQIFLDGGCGLSVTDVTGILRTEACVSSVYRCLAGLAEAGFLRHSLNSDGVVQYRCTSSFFPDHGHFHCEKCGGIIPVSSSLPDEFIKSIERSYGLTIENADLHLEGRCSRCSK
jgi:Fur family ferric uptake transcriptional regulator